MLLELQNTNLSLTNFLKSLSLQLFYLLVEGSKWKLNEDIEIILKIFVTEFNPSE